MVPALMMMVIIPCIPRPISNSAEIDGQEEPKRESGKPSERKTR